MNFFIKFSNWEIYAVKQREFPPIFYYNDLMKNCKILVALCNVLRLLLFKFSSYVLFDFVCRTHRTLSVPAVCKRRKRGEKEGTEIGYNFFNDFSLGKCDLGLSRF